MRSTDKSPRESLNSGLIIISILFFIGCSTKNLSQKNNSINNQRYRVLVVLGTPKSILINDKKNTGNEILINEIVKINEPFTFITTDKYKTIDGRLSKAADGKLHFKGRVHVFSTAASYNQEITLFEGYPPNGTVLSSAIHLFYIQFEKI
jgi:hypothetical protein